VYQQLEIEHGAFQRTIALGAEVRADEAKAVYEDGFLQIEIPIALAETRTRSVPIEVPKAPEE
jgi:HSP20 family protein